PEGTPGPLEPGVPIPGGAGADTSPLGQGVNRRWISEFFGPRQYFMSGPVGWVFAGAPPPMPDTASTASVKGNLPGFMLSILSPSCDHERRSGGDPVTA